MPRRVLDTNILINHWGDACDRHRPRPVTQHLARQWGRALVRLRETDAILTPIYLEYICGQQSRDRVILARAYLSIFDIVDGGSILEQDWEKARRLAERVLPDRSPRQLGDCLVRAICTRLRLDVATVDRRFPH
jgi:predicted nucleic acid-binding protein